MRGAAVITLIVYICATGCGGGSNNDAQIAKRISAWSDAAVAYNETVGQCARQPNPVHGFWDDCTGHYRKMYSAASTTVLRAVRGCAAARALPGLVKAETAALSSESKWNRQLLDHIGRDYTGPALFGLRSQSIAKTKQASRVADQVSRQVRSASC